MPAETSAQPARTPAEILKAARQRDSADNRGRVLKAVQDTLRDNRRITFATVAREAGGSSWLVYAPGLREHIDQARARQAAQGHQDQRGDGKSPPPASTPTCFSSDKTSNGSRPRTSSCGNKPAFTLGSRSTARQPRPGRPRQRTLGGEPPTVHGGTSGNDSKHVTPTASRRA